MSMKLTIEQVDQELRKLMREQPEFIYNTSGEPEPCYYHKGMDEGPVCSGCIFGQASKLNKTSELLGAN